MATYSIINIIMVLFLQEVIQVALNEDIGNRLRKIRGKRTQVKFVEQLDMFTSNSRSYYSMVEIGKRAPNLKLLDMISDKENVSYDYIFGVVDNRADIHDPRYHQLLEAWCNVDDNRKDQILAHANKIMKGEN